MEAISVKLSYNGSHRRFKIRGDNVKAMHSDLMSNVAQLTAHGLPVEIAWQDEDGDSVIISRPAELEEAIESRKDNLLRLHTIEKTNGNERTKSKEEDEKPSKAEDTPQNTPAGNEAVHGNVVCDVCDTPIIGTRYKCILCVDYDLCQNCERTGVHANHGMVRIVDPMRTYVPWGARLRYTRRSGQYHHPHAPPTIDGVVHRLRMQEKKEQITEQVVKGMQYLTEIGQVVTSALANFGIDASYEVQVDDNKDEKKEDKTEEKQEEKKEETLKRKPELFEENKKEEAKLKPEPEIPVVKPDPPKDELKKDAFEKKEKGKKLEKKKDCLPSFRDFPYLQSAEADYRRATAEPIDDSKKITEHRRGHEADSKKQTPPASFGLGGRGALYTRSWRSPYSRTSLYDRDYDRYYDDRTRCPFYDERKKVRDEHETRGRDRDEHDTKARDRRRCRSPLYDSPWYTYGRRSERRHYDSFEDCLKTLYPDKKLNVDDDKCADSGSNRVAEKKAKKFVEVKTEEADVQHKAKEREDTVKKRIKELQEQARSRRGYRPADEGLKKAVEEAARMTAEDDYANCRCFITQIGYRQQRSGPCSACRRKLAKSKSAQSSSHSSFEHEEKPDIAFPDEENKAKSESKPVMVTPHVEELIEDKPIRRSRLCSSGSSSDSDFEALSYENFREEYENEKVTASAPQLSSLQSNVEPVTPPTTPPEVPDNSAPPTLYPELEVESVEAALLQDQTIANRLIEMGFSAEEVFRVVKMHGCNFEKCLEEILAKGH